MSSYQHLEPVQLSRQKAALSRFGKNIPAMLALIILIVIVLLSFGAPWIATGILHKSPNAQDLLNNFEPWFSKTHILGTDELGRDELTRVLFAGRVSLIIGMAVTLLQSILGVTLGLLAGYCGGWIDDAINFILQTVRGIPLFFFLITLSVLFKPTLLNLISILSLIGWTGTCRQVRGLVLSIREREYIEVARSLGASTNHIFVHHIFPNVSPIVLVTASFGIASTIITESSLSFLGFGVQAPIPSWGNMLSSALGNITVAPWLIVIPGSLITITVLCTFLLTDGIRDTFDPYM